MSDEDYKIIPGRGLVTQKSIELRNEYLKEDLGFNLDEIEKTSLSHSDVQKNIESLVGSVELPTGIVGPLKYNEQEKSEDVYCIAGTLEGALIASMNRGAKAISMSGGFTTTIVRHRMVRAPLFIFSTADKAVKFGKWIGEHYDQIKSVAESYSNHAGLLDVEIIQIDYTVHAKFAYSTSDAAGQNMTTTCTWHAILWSLEKFKEETNIEPTHFTVEGNGSSDKKVSKYVIESGRGIKVIAECEIREEVMQRILRTSSKDFMVYNEATKNIADRDGMLGYNVNVANAIAAIFVATGQDLASIHESSLADLCFSLSPNGLKVRLTLYSLVIGTVGGGTHLPKQNQALKIMSCEGDNKVKRFASLIAGFAMGLEISTSAALASGEFAKAHEKLGRNKPVDWLQWREIDQSFIENIVKEYLSNNIQKIQILKGDIDNGILMNLSKMVNSKLLGFIPLEIVTDAGTTSMIIKSKPLDIEVVKGLHIMAASIDPTLSDELSKNRLNLEYQGSHYKELVISKSLHQNNFNHSPIYYGNYTNDIREIYLLFQERLRSDKMKLMDSENHPEHWNREVILSTIRAISEIHSFYLKNPKEKELLKINEFGVAKSKSFYQKLNTILITEYPNEKFYCLEGFLNDILKKPIKSKFRKTLVHNDFNPRNIAIRNNGEVCIYDWELAVNHFPHRDVIEFLSFVLIDNFEKSELVEYLKFYFELSKDSHHITNWEEWKIMYAYTIKEYLVTRVSFYKAAEILMKLKFVDRVYHNCLRMINFLEEAE
jgi:hydroxymethylglutaryl-CoA reductase (NADPH)